MTHEMNLRDSARSGVLWGVGFTLARDVIQFGAMLVLVRLLSPEIYGQQALAQTIIGLIAVVSLKTLAQYPLQARNPEDFDWDSHFTAGATINIAIFVLTVLIGAGLYYMAEGGLSLIGLLVAVISPVFLIEIPGTYRLSWLQTHHEWKRLRTLLLIGAVLASSVGILLAWLGWGVFALAIMSLLLSVPLGVDLLLFSKQRPRFSFSHLRRYRDGALFGANRAVSSVAFSGRALLESAALTASFGFSGLGSFSRAVGLAQITSGRIGPVAAQTLYPILTRADAASHRFRRFAALMFQGIAWLSVPSAAFLALESRAVVELLYGAKWDSVVPLLPLAGLFIALRGLSTALNQIMLANLQTTDCLRVDIAAVIAGVAAIAVGMPLGVVAYLIALGVCELLTLLAILYFAVRGGAMAARAFVDVITPCAAATLLAAMVVSVLPTAVVAEESGIDSVTRLLAHAAAFGAAYVIVLRLTAPKALTALLDALPLQPGLRTAIGRFLAAPAANT